MGENSSRNKPEKGRRKKQKQKEERPLTLINNNSSDSIKRDVGHGGNNKNSPFGNENSSTTLNISNNSSSNDNTDNNNVIGHADMGGKNINGGFVGDPLQQFLDDPYNHTHPGTNSFDTIGTVDPIDFDLLANKPDTYNDGANFGYGRNNSMWNMPPSVQPPTV